MLFVFLEAFKIYILNIIDHYWMVNLTGSVTSIYLEIYGDGRIAVRLDRFRSGISASQMMREGVQG